MAKSGGGRARPGKAARWLPAKSSVPRLTSAVLRARVFRLLERGLSRGAVWVVAPAGAGKTTAVASYLAARKRAAVWYDVDATDTDVANVFRYLASGLQAATRSRRRPPEFRIQHQANLRAFAHKFFEAFYAALLAGGTLVLDNCHTVATDEAWTQILEEAVRAVPEGRSLLLVSRVEPPACFARQIMSERLTRVGFSELRFTDEEARQLARARVPRLSKGHASEVRELCALAGGWAAGLVLVLPRVSKPDSSTRQWICMLVWVLTIESQHWCSSTRRGSRRKGATRRSAPGCRGSATRR